MSSEPIDPVPFDPMPVSRSEKTPPPPVVYAAWSQYAILALAVVSTIITVVSTMDLVNQMRDAMDGVGALTSEVTTILGLIQVVAIGLAVVMLLFAVGIGILGYFNLRGKNGARITTWVLAGIGLACGVCNGVSAPFASTDVTVTGGTDETSRLVNEAMSTVDIPAWQNTVGIVLLLISTLLYLGVIILLALPASNDYFRKDPPVIGIPPSHFG
ncbi:hypothetical protein FB566_2554 [Stackebrandtia endophytica]|uniref:Uncharacterized protein n=1 Tax=Stackebrandtia endophytica TaxID=1496996 RepID=A0A543AWS8_9ACTN|nr:hypothetical protein [Stackebrandtia endophytica]TQL77010.1 hypothetical protein FB566_2554 [Stackebrandtia endophytica]